MNARIRLGHFADDGYRLRVVLSGGDIDDPDFEDLVFDSDLSTMRIVQEGSQILTSTGENSAITIPDQGFIPLALVGFYTSAGVAIRHRTVKYQFDPSVFSTVGDVPDSQTSSRHAITGFWDLVTNSAVNSQPMCKACMPYAMIDDNSTGGAGRYKGLFGADVRQTSIRFMNWASPPVSGNYIARYYIFGIPVA